MQETTLNREAPKVSTLLGLDDTEEEAKTLSVDVEELGEAADQGGAFAEIVAITDEKTKIKTERQDVLDFVDRQIKRITDL